MRVTTLLRADGVLLGQMLLDAFGSWSLPVYPDVLDRLMEAFPDVRFAPTLACWQEAVQLYEAHLNDEADELIDSLESHEYNLEQS